ncbi:cytochrome P450 [Actinomadura violacea]|uniref:Cytochrome P450 n=1 Tax=Actinomadura violacea TaxID=2819934 RepID=A0ABS3RP52_9ACTN|nr:cytochrome P450 [Actinomadura violacea]MBO2457840.1 cytochrome P450 [Actinomadura violacea]
MHADRRHARRARRRPPQAAALGRRDDVGRARRGGGGRGGPRRHVRLLLRPAQRAPRRGRRRRTRLRPAHRAPRGPRRAADRRGDHRLRAPRRDGAAARRRRRPADRRREPRPDAFPDPDGFRPDRAPNPHLGFGHGRHMCLGAPRARMSLQVAVAALLRRLDGLDLAVDPARLRRRERMFVRGVWELPVTWRCGPRR